MKRGPLGEDVVLTRAFIVPPRSETFSALSALALHAEEHPDDQADQCSKEDQQKATQCQRHRTLLFRLGPGNAEGCDEALYQEIQ